MTNKYYLMLANILENGRMQSNKKGNILFSVLSAAPIICTGDCPTI